jgi:LPXTG-site transpeptidase (sortase) family protein
MKEDDEIIVKIGDVMYKYKIVKMYEIYPNDLDILDQRQDDAYLSLVTCVPPGHPLKPKRLVVKAKLSQI